MTYNFLKPFFNVLIPPICSGCDQALLDFEEVICTSCRMALNPFPFYKKENPLLASLLNRIPVKEAQSLFLFEKTGVTQHLIHFFKYKGFLEVGNWLGVLAAQEILKRNLFSQTDLIIPVPLHPNKKKLRGFNQSEVFAKNLNQIAPLESNLKRVQNQKSQTTLGRIDRWENVKSSFELISSENTKDKHLLLIDDTFTTGATLEACARPLLDNGCASISVFTMAYAP